MNGSNKVKSKQNSSCSPGLWPALWPPEMLDKFKIPNTYELKPPMYQIRPQYLIEDHVEKTVQFIGEIDGVSPDLDITNRTDVLRIIDKGKKEGAISVYMSHDKFAVFSLSVFNIKIIRYKNGTEDLTLRIPVHEIAGVCYIKDDKDHILAIKFGTRESCKLALLFCESKSAAEEICSLVNQCFTLVYTETTIDSIEKLISPLERQGSSSAGSASTLIQRHAFQPDSVHNFTDSAESEIADIGTGKELLRDFMVKLTTKLSAEELRMFQQHLNFKDSHISEFCDKVLYLLGSERKHLLSEMQSFISLNNNLYFEEFLRRNDIRLLESASIVSSSRTDLRNYSNRRSMSGASITSSFSNNAASGDALDQLLDLRAEYNSVDGEIPEDYL